ncbi:uncharacterized protein LOC104441331 [Eucalyptus grandis]|uniref:uncharacterized protein LOC104441331 n=1 Tax=Eucalyptus grandis TaxID=71139 RepID=UPI00192EE5D9|nr:uncharacterized protein LOC104441331 [Eucalyptus grandis]
MASKKMIHMVKDGNDNRISKKMILLGLRSRTSKQNRISKEESLRASKRISKESLGAASASASKKISKQRLRAALKRKRISEEESLRASKRISKESLGAASASEASKHVPKQRFFYWVPGSTVSPATCPHPLTTRGICECCWKLLPSVCPLPPDLMLELLDPPLFD